MNREMVIKRIFKVIKEKGLTSKEICKELGITDQTLLYWKTGRSYPIRYNLENLANLLDVSPKYFELGDDWDSKWGIYESTFAGRLKKVMVNRNIYETGLSNLTGISITSIYCYLNNGRIPRKEKLDKLAEGLNTTPEYLLVGVIKYD